MRLRAARSLQARLRLILLATVGVALALAGVALLLVEADEEWRDAHATLASQADVIGLASEAALSFGDAKVGEQNLRALQAQPETTAAALYDASGRLFARYVPPAAAPATLPAQAPPPGLRFGWTSATVVRPVLSNRETIGSIYIESRHGLLEQLLKYVGWLAAVGIASLLAALLLARRLQQSVIGPIQDVAQVARTVLDRGAFDVRATKHADDEVGQLVDAFNAMLDELGARARVLQESNRAKDEFLATLAHELRNPLAPLRTGLQILRKPRVPEPVQHRTLETMDRQLTHMVRLVDDLLDISRITSGKIRLEPARISLRETLQTALELARPAIDAAGHSLHVELPDAALELQGDGTRLAQAFGNLLNNAAKYTPAGGRVDLRARQEGANAVVEIADNGVGIPPDMLENVFHLFAQVTPSSGALASGLGIGLFLVRRLVEMHGGSVVAHSAGEGRGSTFTVTLPCLPAAAAAADASPPAAAPGSPAQMRILVVDDNVDAADTLATFLGMLGAQTRAVHDGPAATPAALDFAPDLVLLDIGLPGMSGYEVARAMRAQPALARVPLVALTGWGTEEDRRRALDAGFDDHLTKPVDLAVLEQTLRRLALEPR